MKTISQPALEKATQWLTELIRIKRFEAGSVLPSIRLLAHECSVSPMSMHKAIGILREQGLIAGSPNHRPHVTFRNPISEKPLNAPLAMVAITSIERIEIDLRKRILGGELATGQQVPSVKELRQHYQTSHKTLQRIIAKLHHEGLLEIDRRWFRIKLHGARKATARIVLIGFSYVQQTAIILGHHDGYLFNLLQTDCSRRNLILEQAICPMDTCAEVFRVDDGRPLKFTDEVEGYVVLLNQFPEKVGTLFKLLETIKRPVAIIDEMGYWTPGEYFRTDSKVKVFSFSSGHLAAREIAQILLHYGHRFFAYVSPFSRAAWSMVRRNALSKELLDSGLEHQLYLHEISIPDDFPSHNLIEQAQATHAEMLSILKKRSEMDYKAYERSFSWYWWHQELDSIFIESTIAPLVTDIFKDANRPTAIIAVNDSTAAIIQSCLQKLKSYDSQEIALISFDNSSIAQHKQISSYDFNVPGIVATVLNYILDESDSRQTFAIQREDVKGTLVERASMRIKMASASDKSHDFFS